MYRRDFLCKTAAFVASPMILSAGPAMAKADAIAADPKAVVKAQALYEQVLRAGLGEPYLAPLHTDPDGPRYLWGGLDPISLLERYKLRAADDIGGLVFLSRQGGNLGKPEFAADVPIYPGGPVMPALFASAENRTMFEQRVADGSFMVMLGMNCLWGTASGPGTDGWRRPVHSHWAQPGLGAIYVEQFRHPDSGKDVTALGAVFYLRADDWQGIRPRGWAMSGSSFRELLDDKEPWRRRRPYLPVVTVT